MSDAADLRLLEDVQYHFALADTDEKLEKTLKASNAIDHPSQAVKAKIVSICSHVSKRTKTAPVNLPTEALITQFFNPSLGPYVKNFNLIYLDMALNREPNLDVYAPKLIHGISKIPQSSLKGYFPIMMRALARWKFDYDSPAFQELLGLEEADVKILTGWFERLLLYDGTAASVPIPPAYISKDGFPNLRALNAAKMAAVKLTRGVLGGEGALTLFIGTKDGNSEVAEFCADAIKRGGVNLEDERYVRGLYDLYFAGPKLNLQIAIVESLSKSVFAANLMPQLLQLVEAGFRGNSHPKLQRAHIGFVQWAMRMTSDDIVLPVTQPLLASLLSALEQADTPTELRQFFYVCIGLIARRNPTLIQRQIGTLRLLFQAVTREHATIKVSITECLSMVFPAVQNPPSEFAGELLSLVQDLVRDAPDVAVKFAFAFPFSLVEARAIYLRVLNQFEIGSDLRESARYGLDPYYFRITTQVSRNNLPQEFYSFPPFDEAVNGLVELGTVDVIETLRYLRTVLLHEVLANSVKFDDEGWRDQLDTAVEVDETVRTMVRNVFRKWAQEHRPGLENYFKYLRHVLTTGNDEEIGLAVSLLLELVSHGGKDMSAALVPDTNVLRDLVFARSEVLRENAAHLLGIITTTSEAVEPMIRGFLRLAEGSVEKQHGAILAVGSILARLAMKGRLSVISDEILDKFSIDLTNIIVSPNTNTILLDGALQALSELCIFGAGTLLQESRRNQITVRLQTLSKTPRYGHIQDRSVLTLGHLSFSLRIPDDQVAINKILDTMYAIHEQKQVELLFSAGQALSCIAARWGSKAMTPYRDSNFDMQQEPLPDILDGVLNTILEGIVSPKHSLRKAASIWLLSILQFCDEMDVIRRNLEKIHNAFLSLLTDRDDFVQETASKGLALVYLRGDKKMQEDLVWSLVGSVTAEVRPSTTVTGPVTAETQLLGLRTSDAGEVNTYKEICNLASDTGNPELIYRFLALSSHSALWQSKKGAAIGIGTLLDQLSMQELLEKNPNYAKRLVPKLFRLCRDPNPSVAKAMQDIWDAAFGRTGSPLVASMFPEIITELLRGMGDKAWRTRQASAKAMGDLLSAVHTANLEPYLEEIWKMAFRVADDIKESVRNTGMMLAQQLTNSLVRSVSEGKSGQGVISIVMPFLLGNSGLNASPQGVQLFALRSIVKLCEEAGPLLKPLIPEIVDQLLDVLTTLEPQVVNYIGFHVEQKDTQTLDESRFHAVRSSPVMSAIEQCIDLADEANVHQLASIVFNKIRRAAGLPTKAGCAKLLVSLVMRKGHLFRPYADQALKAVTVCLNDRNETVQKTYAATAGYLARLASYPALVKYIESQTAKYFSEDEQQRVMSGITIEAISRNASSAFTAIASSILPFVFLAKHDPVESIREPFTETWSENTGGAGAIKLYIRQIMTLLAGRLEDPQWRVKQVAALTLADACEAIGVDIREHLSLVMPLLLKGVGGRTWKGKEAVLKALVVVAQNAKEALSPAEIEEISKVMIREANRKDLEYKRLATAELGKYLSAFPSIHLFEQIKQIVQNGLDELNEDGEGDLQTKPIRLLLRANLYSIASAGYQPSVDADRVDDGIWIINLISKEIPVATIWSTRIALCNATQAFINKCIITPQLSFPESNVASLWESLKIVAGDRGYESVRTAAAKTVGDFVGWVEGHPEWIGVQQTIKGELPGIIAAETSSVIRAEYTR